MRVAVVGAGLAGLAAAHFLRREAARRDIRLDLAVYEASARAGGRIRTVEDHGYRIECAANGVQGDDGAAARLVKDLGLAGERVKASPGAARRYLACRGSLHLLPTSPPALLSFGAISPRARLRVLAEPIVARRVAREETVLKFASRHVGEEAARALAGAAVRGIFAGDAAKLSLDSAFPLMREMERKHRSLFLAMSHAKKQLGGRGLWSLRAGMGGLVRALADSTEARLRLNAPVLSIERTDESQRAGDSQWTGEGKPPGWRIRLASGERTEADAVIVTTPPKAAAALFRQLEPEIARRLSTIESAGVAVVALAFLPQAFRSKPDGYGFLVAPGEDLEILGAVFESNLFPERAPKGRILVRAMMGGVDRPELLARTDAELVALAMKALDRTLGLAIGPERTWVIRQEESIPQYVLGHRSLVGSIASGLDALPGLYVTGNAYRGVSVGSVIEDAARVATRALS
ncbi:MAG: protoporphyrinogen oxidase [Candidatus Eisenbacteria bacterium]|uniref:Coproporphyrinogen III oxidase n=1 Tax=Eiseniibacteriota bacterium TaxID=2212470 RepID=A0A538TNI9_UNCEI|nr:MAG: protoporphyrinogen oxidase [Candidatus Eisenbacteria bacterium]